MTSLLIVAPLLISLCAAATRAISGISIEASFALSAPLWILLLILTHKTWPPSSPLFRKATYQALGITLLSLAPFFILSSYGFINLGTADGGNHIRFYQSFISTTPDAYHGFVGFYALIFLVQETLGVFPEVALLIALGYTIFALTEMLSMWTLTKGVSLLSVLALNFMVIVPTVLTLQTNGFYPQLYGLSILIFYLIRCDRPLNVRSVIPLSLLGAGLLRYSYGLTLADVFLAGSFYLLARRKIISSVALLTLGIYTVTKLLPVITLPGAFTPMHTTSLIIATILLLLGVREHRGLPLLVVASSLLVWCTLGITIGFEHYYVQKYPMGICLLTGVLALQSFSSSSVRQRVPLASSLVFLCIAVYPYTNNAIDIARGRFVNPEVDLKLTQEIRSFLTSNNKPFRTFLGSKWARTNMVNAVFGHEYSYQEFAAGTLPPHPGCVFFDATDGIVARLKKDKLPELSQAIDTLLWAPHLRITYDAPWSKEGELTLGIACESHSRALANE